MKAQEFLDYVKKAKSKNTSIMYRQGLKKFSGWYGKDLDTILKERSEDLESKDPTRRRRFEHKLEEFHRSLMENYAVNTCRALTQGLIQAFSYFDLDMKMRVISSEAKRMVETDRSYPLTIEDVRAMYVTAGSLRDKTILLLGKDLGLRVADVLSIKKDEIPDLGQEAPISFQRMTGKEKVLARGFFSEETVNILKAYLPTLRSKLNPYLFPNTRKGPISDDTINNVLKALAARANIKVPNGQSLTFHCFRKLFLSYCIESGVGLTAGKLMCGKAVPKSDRTYIRNTRLKKLFIQLQKMLAIYTTDQVALDPVRKLKNRIEQLEQRDNGLLTVVQQIQEEIARLKTDVKALKPAVKRKLTALEKTIFK